MVGINFTLRISKHGTFAYQQDNVQVQTMCSPIKGKHLFRRFYCSLTSKKNLKYSVTSRGYTYFMFKSTLTIILK